MPYVYSTLSNSVTYTIWDADSPDYHTESTKADKHKLPRKLNQVLIKGGANVATPGNRITREIITPKGVRTEVTDEELALLKNNFHFKKHIEKGFITIDDVKVNPDKVAKSQETRDSSAPKTPGDYEKPIVIAGEKVKIKPTTNKPG